MLISSQQNDRIKKMVSLQKKSAVRRECGLFVVEGLRELGHCSDAGYEIQAVYYCPSILERATGSPALPSYLDAVTCFEVTPDVYEKMAYRGSTEGIVAEVKTRTWHLEDLRLPEHPLVMVLESVEKPGNLGAVLRSADAAHADAVIICDPLTDLYNPNLIRSSIGAIFSVPVWPALQKNASPFSSRKASVSLPPNFKTPAFITTPTCAAARPSSWVQSRQV